MNYILTNPDAQKRLELKQNSNPIADTESQDAYERNCRTVCDSYVRITQESHYDKVQHLALLSNEERSLNMFEETMSEADYLQQETTRIGSEIKLQFEAPTAYLVPWTDIYTLVSDVDLDESWIEFIDIPKKIFLLGCTMSQKLTQQCYDSGNCNIYYYPAIRMHSPHPKRTVGDPACKHFNVHKLGYAKHHNLWHLAAGNCLDEEWVTLLRLYRPYRCSEPTLVAELLEYTNSDMKILVCKMIYSHKENNQLDWFSPKAPFNGLMPYDIGRLLRYRTPLEISILMGMPFMQEIILMLSMYPHKLIADPLSHLFRHTEMLLNYNPDKRYMPSQTIQADVM